MSGDIHFYYELGKVDSDSGQFQSIDVAFVVLSSASPVVAEFRREVKLENSNTLAKVDISQMKVFENKAVFQSKSSKPLEYNYSLRGKGGLNEPLLVAVVPALSLAQPEPTHVSKKLKADSKIFELSTLSTQLKALSTVQLKENCYIESGKDVPLQSRITKVYVRRCYKDVFALLVKFITERNRHVFGLSGTPGIGKSMFFVYILFRILKMEAGSPWKPSLIIYQNGQDFKLYDLVNLDVVIVDRKAAELKVDVDDKKIFYVVDGRASEPVRSACITLFIASPRTEHFKSFVKQRRAKKWYFPVWSLEELSLCRAKCYDFFPQENLENLFLVYGGVARFAFYDFETSQNNKETDRKDSLEFPSNMSDALADAKHVDALNARFTTYDC